VTVAQELTRRSIPACNCAHVEASTPRSVAFGGGERGVYAPLRLIEEGTGRVMQPVGMRPGVSCQPRVFDRVFSRPEDVNDTRANRVVSTPTRDRRLDSLWPAHHDRRLNACQHWGAMRASRRSLLRRPQANSDDHDLLMAELAALHEGHARYVLGYANALLQSRELAEEASLEVLLTGWRAGLAREPDQRAIRLLLMSLVLREVAVLRRQVRNSCRDTPQSFTNARTHVVRGG
jgi:hypothetical protein